MMQPWLARARSSARYAGLGIVVGLCLLAAIAGLVAGAGAVGLSLLAVVGIVK